jgi:hypothetical protein
MEKKESSTDTSSGTRSQWSVLVGEDQDIVGFVSARLELILSRVRQGENAESLLPRFDEIVEDAVMEISALTAPFDAFDVLDLMRQREIISPSLGSGEEVSAANVELVGLVLLARGDRIPTAVGEGQLAHQIISSLHDLASLILVLSAFKRMSEADSDGSGLAKLRAKNLMHGVQVRNLQYEEVQSLINFKLFGATTFEFSGNEFSYADILAVRDAIRRKYFEEFDAAVVTLGEIASGAGERASPSQESRDIEKGRDAAFNAFLTPGSRASFTADDLQGFCEIDSQKISAVLASFCAEFVESNPVDVVNGFLSAENPFTTRPLVKDSQGNFIQVTSEIGADQLRHKFEKSSKPEISRIEYESVRSQVSEDLTVEHLQLLLDSKVFCASLEYFAPLEGRDVTQLGQDASGPSKVGKKCEADALFVIDDVAICVEVKSNSLKTGAKTGDSRALKNDLIATIGKASRQAQRLAELIQANGGLWRPDKSWVDLSQIREVHSIVATLDDLAPLSMDVENLERSQILSGERVPWVVSIHDLMVIARVLERPSEFLLYLRRRTEPSATKKYFAQDELDLFMHFLHGGLYVEPDPEWVQAQFPFSPKPTKEDKKRFKSQAGKIIVGNLTTELDEWMDNDGSEPTHAKPAFVSHPAIFTLVDFLANKKLKGWLRFGADLLHLDMETQEYLVRNLQAVAHRTKADGLHHSFAMSFEGAWGFPSFFAYTWANNMKFEEAVRGLTAYMTAKKHQLLSDRALGLLLNQDGLLIGGHYLNDVPGHDVELDTLVEYLKLPAVKRDTPKPPPYARRGTSRLRGRRKSR